MGYPSGFPHGYAEDGSRLKSPNIAKWRARDAPVMPRPWRALPLAERSDLHPSRLEILATGLNVDSGCESA
jgi:hypothetical protein